MRNFHQPGLAALCVVSLITVGPVAMAGDPYGVNQALRAIKTNWPDAQFSIDVTGGLDNNAVLADQALQVEYEAAHPGYLTYLRVSSHGDILPTRVVTAGSSAQGTLPVPVQSTLGHEQAIFLFSAQPLAPLLGEGSDALSLGNSVPQADAVVRRIKALQAAGLKVAARHIDYMVEARLGATQYTTRSVVRMVESLPSVRFPTRIEFQFGSDRLTPASQRDLDIFGDALANQLRGRKVLLEGHTDAIGTDRYNMQLSFKRAQAAEDYLVASFGLPSDLIDVTGKGKLGKPTDPEAQRSIDRRVDFIFGSGASR